jgi:pyruvate oxidase
MSPQGVSLWGDCAAVIPLLTEKTREKHTPGVLDAVTEMKQSWNAQIEREADPSAIPIRPPYIMQVLSDLIPDDSIISIDVGENGWWFGRNFRMKRQRFVMSGYLGTMGFGLPGAIAAKLGMPDRTVFCITGDGGFTMAMADFVTAVKYDLPIIVVILNNHDLAMIRVEQTMEQYPNFATDLLNTDFTAFAEASGGAGIHVERPELFAPAVREALLLNRPVVIDVETDPRRFPL